MAKIMLVEDDKNLSSIYKDRLLAEGYDIVEAHDGEEALALAVKEKPVLIISDVMMPKISGFDMLDILRSTPETKNTKVIMMTALSQSEDQQRATQLGADKYLVKSQVTLDDVARVVKEVLGDGGLVTSTQDAQAVAPLSPETSGLTQQLANQNTAPNPNQTPSLNNPVATENEAATMPDYPNLDSLQAEPAAEEKKEIENEIDKLAETIPAEAPIEVQPEASGKDIQPVSNPNDKPDIMALYEKEMANESNNGNPQDQPPTQPVDPHSISL